MADIFDSLASGAGSDVFDAAAQRPTVPPPAGVSPAQLSQQWASSGPMDRVKMMLSNFLPYAKTRVANDANAVANMGVRAGLPAAGQAVGTFAGPFAPIARPVLGAFGGGVGEAIAEGREGNGYKPGKIVGATLMGAIPGASLEKAGAVQLGKEATKQASANVASKAAETILDENRLPTLSEATSAAGGAALGTGMAKVLDQGLNASAVKAAVDKAQQTAVRATLKIGKDLGLVLPPSMVKPGLVNNTLNSIGGKAATAQAAIERNQPIINMRVNEELGLPPKLEVTTEGLNTAKQSAEQVYRDISKLSPQAQIALDTYKNETSNLRLLMKAQRENYDSNRTAQIAEAKHNVDEALDLVTQEAKNAGKPELMDKLKDSRIQLAKIALVEDSLKKGAGNVDPQVFARAYDYNEPLTGNLEKIGRFASTFEKATKDATNTPKSGVNQLVPFLSGIGGGAIGGHYLSGNAAMGAATAAAMMFTPQMAREFMLSKPFQRGLEIPVRAVRQDIPAMVAQYAANAAGRGGPPAPPPYLAANAPQAPTGQ